MSKITLQLPVDKSLKISAEKMAREQGFSSLQEVLRIFMMQFANRKLRVHLAPVEDEILTTEQESILTNKYRKAKKDIDAGKGLIAHSADELLSQLRS